MPTPALRPFAFALTACLALCTTACSDVGIHSLAIEGNDAVTAGLDAAATDGWTISFSSLVVVVHNPGLIERINNKPVWVREAGVTVWDAVSGLEEGEALARQIRATRYDGVDFRVGPVSTSGYEAVAGNVDADTLAAAVEDDWSIHVVGSGELGGTTVAFDWTFDTDTFYRCELGDEALELGADGDETTTIEILGDALFRTEAGNADAALAFQPIADADADGDGTVTNAELDAAGLGDSVAALSAELGGVRGLGECPEYVAPAEEG